MKKMIWFIFGIVISILMLYIVFKNVNFNDVLKYICTANIFYLLISLFLGFLLLMLRSYRWKLLVKEYENYSFSNFFVSTVLGLFFNNVFPFRMGDFVQGLALSRKISLPKSFTVSSVFMERFLDLFPPIVFIIIGSFFVVLPKQFSVVLSILILLFLILGLMLMLKFKSLIIKFVKNLSDGKQGVLSKLANFIEKFFSALSNLSEIKILCKVIPLTILLWVGYSIGMFFICLALDIELPSVWASFLIQAITSASVIIPSSPGYVGTWEFMGSLAVSIFKVAKSKAVAFSLISHFLGIIPIVVLGVIFLLKELSLLEELKKDSSQGEFYET